MASLEYTITLSVVVVLIIVGYRSYNSRRDSSGTLTSIGVLGTFVGISIALLQFDSTDINSSVPHLLDGMKTAFFTSVAGMTAALLLKLALWQRRQTEDLPEEGATADDIAALLDGGFKGLTQALAGGEEGSLLSQIKIMRQESADQSRQVLKSLDEFAAKVADNNSAALIDALQQVMRDFNAKINEQFGENFKELNAAVGKLLDWQENYKQILEQTLQAHERTAQSFETLRHDLSGLVEQSKVFVSSAETLEEILAVYQRSHWELENKMTAFAELSRQAQEAFPIIRQQIENMTDGFSNAVSLATDKVTQASSMAAESTTKAVDTMEQLAERTNEALVSLSDKIHAEMQEQSRRSQEAVANSAEELEKLLEDELKRSLQSLGDNLATLSEHFVKDYERLTQSLKRIASGSAV